MWILQKSIIYSSKICQVISFRILSGYYRSGIVACKPVDRTLLICKDEVR